MSKREFHCTEGGSQKFWAIEVQGKSFTVQFGRLGTAGQEQKKTFKSEVEAQKAADKLIAEKTKKGYAEMGATPAAPAAVVKAAPAAARAPPPAAPVVTRHIDLDPADWFWAAWRNNKPLARPTPEPFDLDRGLKLLAKRPSRAQWAKWERFPFPAVYSPQEAHFWFVALTDLTYDDPDKKPAPKYTAKQFTGRPSAAEVKARLLRDYAARDDHVFDTLPYLLSPADLVALLLDKKVLEKYGGGFVYETWFTTRAFPYFAEEGREAVRRMLRPHVGLKSWPADVGDEPPPAFFLAVPAGLHEELLAVVESWPDDCYRGQVWHPYTQRPDLIVYGLGDARLVEHHARRLKLELRPKEGVRGWLAHTEYAALDLVRDAARSNYTKADLEEIMDTFCRVKAPEAAPYMLELRLDSKVQAQATAWLEEQPGNAVAGLIPTAAGRGKLAEAAVGFQRAAGRRGLGDFIEEQLRQAPPEVADKVRAEVFAEAENVGPPFEEKTTPCWLRDALAASAASPAELPAWARDADLPPVAVGGNCLSAPQVLALLAALRDSPLGSPRPLVSAVRQHADRLALDRFAWRLCEAWLGTGAPPKERWAMTALGHLGGDESVLKLTPRVRAWPGESQHPRAVLGLEVLRAVGTDTALMQLNGIAQKLKFKGLQNKAREFMEAIAADRGLTKDQLEDRIVPDLGLDEKGSRTLDFGPRRFQVVLGPDLTPLVRDESGAVKPDLPKPGAKDDAAKAAEAVAEWKVLKKALRDAAKVQARRLEQAMVTGKRWSVEEFETLLVRHPLMVNLVRRLLWGGYDGKGKLVRLFRLNEEGEYADEKDAPCTLKGVDQVGVVHPLHLTAQQRAAWGEVFVDYEILAPFPQLGRPVHELDKDEAKGTEIRRFANIKVGPGAMLGTMEQVGWTRGSASDHGVIQEFSKPFPAQGVTAVLENEPGVMLGLMAHSEDQKVPRCFFLKGAYAPVGYPRHTKLLPLKQVDRLAVSEVLADLMTLASKGK